MPDRVIPYIADFSAGVDEWAMGGGDSWDTFEAVGGELHAAEAAAAAGYWDLVSPYIATPEGKNLTLSITVRTAGGHNDSAWALTVMVQWLNAGKGWISNDFIGSGVSPPIAPSTQYQFGGTTNRPAGATFAQIDFFQRTSGGETLDLYIVAASLVDPTAGPIPALGIGSRSPMRLG